MSESAAEPAARDRHFRKAHEMYLGAYRSAADAGGLDDAIYNGINAAATALLLGEELLAAQLAREVQALCQQRLAVGEDYWATASLAEAAFILGEVPAAEAGYRAAASRWPGSFGAIQSTRRSARALARRRGLAPEYFDSCFAMPAVLAFAGHMVDRPGRPLPRFPPELEALVRNAIRSRVARYGQKVGFCSAASGADIVFVEEMLDAGAEVTIVLPFAEEAFLKTSVDLRPEGQWAERFERVLARAARVVIADEASSPGDPSAFEYGNGILAGLARLKAEMLGAQTVPVALWDGGEGDGRGGTAHMVRLWRACGVEPQIIDSKALLAACPPYADARAADSASWPDARAAAEPAPAPPAFTRDIRAMLIADVVGFSKLRERQVPLFVEHFMGTVGAVLEEQRPRPIIRNTWGDALYLVFAEVSAAARFALRLRDRLAAVDWAERELPRDLSLRIALHAGPVFHCRDAVTGSPNCLGWHVNRTARLEPATPPEHVYASEAFAALAAALPSTDFACDYVGQTALAKGAGTLPAYHVRWR
jgi:class 3 adenylate cyclase